MYISSVQLTFSCFLLLSSTFTCSKFPASLPDLLQTKYSLYRVRHAAQSAEAREANNQAAKLVHIHMHTVYVGIYLQMHEHIIIKLSTNRYPIHSSSQSKCFSDIL